MLFRSLARNAADDALILGATGDFEWYDPDAVTTKEGSLVITASEEPFHGLNFRSGMLQSWNKFWCVLSSPSLVVGTDYPLLQLHWRLHRGLRSASRCLKRRRAFTFLRRPMLALTRVRLLRDSGPEPGLSET